MARFVTEKYQPDGGFSMSGVPILLVSLCATGVGLGWVASFIGQWFYLVFAFPVGIGAGLVVVGRFAGKHAKMRSPALAVLVGVVEGTLEAKRETLVMLLRKKFGKKVTPNIVASIERTTDLATLDAWLARILEAST